MRAGPALVPAHACLIDAWFMPESRSNLRKVRVSWILARQQWRDEQELIGRLLLHPKSEDTETYFRIANKGSLQQQFSYGEFVAGLN